MLLHNVETCDCATNVARELGVHHLAVRVLCRLALAPLESHTFAQGPSEAFGMPALEVLCERQSGSQDGIGRRAPCDYDV